ncbi:hypothetical protein [Changpingibacter yushuensis]|uniref:hypothetical protein n=1 Tax=Changpingibacter yushuensis TaxID=2758440 RepID=UPI00165E9136|nr:hypothetical protein [Changpingibacter yushuensis]
MATNQVDWDVMADWAESDASFLRPARGRTLVDEEARRASRELLTRVTRRPNRYDGHAQREQ